ncbi:hypothetical protein LDENG_00213200 [Lucifuga dentata]|nr:hypothetical protein LDENG_00213200 [Lucifuga dentata]
MGLCERMRSWIVLRARVGVLLLGLSLAQSASPQAVCPAGGDLQNLTQPHYQDTAEVEEGVGFMSSLVQSFLSTVQPNPFPKDLIIKFIKDYKELRDNPDVIKQFLRYEVGFLVCAAIGILYIILMPLVGFFLACCRCCGNCGGRMYQEQTSRIHCYRRTFYWTVFITTLIILAGNICMFKSNEAVKVNVDQSLVELNNTFDNLNTFLTAVPQQVDRVVKESYKTVNEVTKNLNDIGPQLGAEIQDRFRGTLEPVLLSIRLMDQETISINDQLNELNASLARLQTSMNLIQKNITTVKDQINQTISSSPCKTCENLKPELQKLTLDTSIAIPALSDFQSAVDDVVKADLKAKIREVEDYFNNIPQTVTNDTKQAVQNAKQQLDDIKHQISQLSRDVPLSALTNVSDALSKLRREISTVTPQVERGEHIRWGVCVAVSCGVLLVVVCNIMGLILGPLGLRPKADPTARSCTADCGGTFLMM